MISCKSCRGVMYEEGIKAICLFCRREVDIPESMRKPKEDAPGDVKNEFDAPLFNGKVVSHSNARKEAMAPDGYVKEAPVFELPPGDEDMEDLTLGEDE